MVVVYQALQKPNWLMAEVDVKYVANSSVTTIKFCDMAIHFCGGSEPRATRSTKLSKPEAIHDDAKASMVSPHLFHLQ